MFLGLKESTVTRTIKTSPKTLAGVCKFPLVICGNRKQSLAAESFAGIRMYIYQRNGLSAAFASSFTRASFTG